ncbi:testis-specific protein 10-interacting protein [Rhynchocyon petersi]
MLNIHQQLVKATEERPGQDPRLQSPGTVSKLQEDLLWDISPAEQRSPGNGDSERCRGQRQRSGSAGQTAKRDWEVLGQKKKECGPAAAEDLPPAPRKPSFPFQWAWESFALDHRGLLPGFSRASGHRAQLAQGARGLPLPPAATQSRLQPRSRRKSTVSLPEPQGSCCRSKAADRARRWKMKAAREEESWARGQPGQGHLQLPRGWQPESQEAAEPEPEALREEELSSGELPQHPRKALVWEQAEAEGAEEREHRKPQERRTRSQKKGQNPGEENHHRGCSSCARDQAAGPRRRRPKTQGLEGPWDLAKLQQHLQQELEEQGLCGPKQSWKGLRTAVQASGRSGKTLREGKTFNFPNRTFHKRQEATRRLLQSREQQTQEERLQAELRQSREQQTQRHVARCLAVYAPRGAQGPAAARRKVEELRRQERQRFVEYQAELQAIQHRVQARPYLFQQVMQANARLTVTRRFSQVLSAVGLNEEQLMAEVKKGDTEVISRKPRSPAPKPPPCSMELRLRCRVLFPAFP